MSNVELNEQANQESSCSVLVSNDLLCRPLLPEPFYQDDYVTIYNADCWDVLPHLGTNFALVSDPPYGINAVYTRTGKRNRANLKNWKRQTFASEQRPSIVNDDKPFDPSHLLVFDKIALFGANHFANKLPPRGKWLIWDKRKGTPSDYNSDAELIWTNEQGAVRLYSHLWRGLVREGAENVANGSKLHPAQKPIALVKWIILQLKIEPPQIIIDPYAGSGTTLAAAKDLGLRAIGIEVEEKYCQIAKNRLIQNPLVF